MKIDLQHRRQQRDTPVVKRSESEVGAGAPLWAHLEKFVKGSIAVPVSRLN